MQQPEIDYIAKALATFSGPRDQLELELRFGKYVQKNDYEGGVEVKKTVFESGVKGAEFRRLRKHLNVVLGLNPTVSISTVSGFTDGYRLVETLNAAPKWERKQRLLFHHENKEYGYRLSSSYEQPIVSYVPKIPATNIRYRRRYSYTLNDCNIELTEILDAPDGNTVNYEVEMEFVGFATDENAVNWKQLFDMSFCSLFDTRLVYSKTQRDALDDRLHNLLFVNSKIQLDRAILAEARDLTKKDMVYGGLVGNSKTVYRGTIKVDGLHRLLVISNVGVWLYNPPHEFNLLFLTANEAGFHGHSETILDGEYVPREKRLDESTMAIDYLYIPYDCLCYMTGDKRGLPHSQRCNIVQTISNALGAAPGHIRSVLTIKTKDFRTVGTVDQFYIQTTWLLEKLATRVYKNDGLIYTPENAPYIPSLRGEAFTGKRVLTSTADVVKWKPSSQMTIDLRLNWQPDGSLVAESISHEIIRQEFQLKDSSYFGEIPGNVDAHKVYIPSIGEINHDYDSEYQNVNEREGTVYLLSKPPKSKLYGLVKKEHYKAEKATKAIGDHNQFHLVVRQRPGSVPRLITRGGVKGRQQRIVDVDYYRLVVVRKKLFIPFTHAPVEGNVEWLRKLPTGTVVEFIWDPSREVFSPLQERPDKETPNGVDIVNGIWRLLQDPITEEDMRGKTLMLMFRYHNRIKTALYGLLGQGNSLLDIGSGKGGDIEKWKNAKLSKVLAVEPNEEYIQEFKTRLNNSQYNGNVEIMRAQGQDVEDITGAVQQTFNDRVNVISFMQSLTFFWERAELVDRLVSMIVSNLKEGGAVLFVAMNGDAAEQAMDPIGIPGPGEGSVDILQGKIELMLQPKPVQGRGREMHVRLVGSKTVQGVQVEYLVRFNDLFKRLRPYGFKVGAIYRALGEKFLTPAEKYLSGMYSFGYLVHDGSAKLPTLVTPRIVSGQLVSTQPSVQSSSQTAPITPPPSSAVKPEIVAIDNDDYYQPLPNTWLNGAVRISCLDTGGNSLIHTILKGTSPTYQNNGNVDYRTQFAAALRTDFTNLVVGPSGKYKGRAVWDVVGYGYYLKRTLEGQQGLRLNDILTYLNSGQPLNINYVSAFSQILNVDIFVFKRHNQDLVPHATTSRKEVPQDAIMILMLEEGKYELLGVDMGSQFQTLWKAGNQSIGFLQRMFQVQDRPIFDPVETVRGLVPAGTIIPLSFFPTGDPLLKLMQDAGYTVA